ncbi:MAG: DUF5045 domain-containing protein [Candidatus Cryptobacteroides sp.]|jgi:hypothetical protein|nr:DUF5045 domain-containing protein [Candidatus Cryptobacteroides sp.]
MACLLASWSYAQTIQHDEQKEKQWRSMENGPWDFAPDWYYYLFHKDYSGAETYWAWRGFKSGLHVRFKEENSNVKRIMPTRVISEETQRQKEEKVEEEMEMIKELHQEEVERAADRNVDLVYSSFKDDFNRMQESISEGLLYVAQKSKGKMNYQVTQLSRQNEMICRNIEYIHRQGIGYELENAKRQKAYMEAKSDMEKLVSRVTHLVGMAQAYYK